MNRWAHCAGFWRDCHFFFFFGGKFDRSKPDPPPPRAHTLRRRPDSRFRSPVLGGRSSGAGAMSANGRYGLDLDASDSEDDDVMRLPGETISKTSPRPRSSSSDASDTTSNEPMPMRVSAEVAFLGEVDGAPSVHRSARKTPSKPALGHALANDLFDVGRFGLGDFFPTRDSRSPRHESGAAGVGPGADALAAAAALRRELAASTNTAQRRVDRKRRVPPASTAFAIAQSVLRDLEQKKPLQFREIKRDPTRVTDAHSMFGSSFRASWGPNGQLVHPGRLCASTVASVGGFQACANAQTQKGSPHAPHAKVTTERFAPGVGGGCVAARVAALEVALQVTVAYASGRDAMDSGDTLDRGDTLDSGDPDSDAPNGWCSATFGKRLRASCSRVDLPGVCDAYLNSVENVALVSNKTPSSDLKLEVSAWDLVKTLWGDAPGAAPVASAADRHRRRASVSEWLRKQTASRGDAVSGVTSPKLLVPEKTATGALVSATRLACSNGDPRLATLIAQSARGGALPELAGAQLKIWRDSVVEKYVPSETTLLFEVIAGEVAPFRSDLPVKDWRTNFGLHLWYGTSPSTTVGKVMDGYLRSVETESATYPSGTALRVSQIQAHLRFISNAPATVRTDDR
jgi:hypothetical protein